MRHPPKLLCCLGALLFLVGCDDTNSSSHPDATEVLDASDLADLDGTEEVDTSVDRVEADTSAPCGFAVDCPQPSNVCEVATCIEAQCGTSAAPSRTSCAAGSGTVCDGNGVCVQCLVVDDCVPGELCDGHQCVPPECGNGKHDGDETDADCGGGACAPCPNGDGCLRFSDCLSGLCERTGENGICSSCTDDLDCQVGSFCDEDGGHDCRVKLPFGELCSSDTMCLTGRCAAGTCQAASVCGDGWVNGAEACDGDGAGNPGETATCDANCSVLTCGDGTVNTSAGELCDDGNGNNRDDCPDGVGGTCVPATCGDGFVHYQGSGAELCDDGNQNTHDSCPDGPGASCLPALCGDGFAHDQGGGLEQCDDANANDRDDCLTVCVRATCGDGVVHDEGSGAEACDDGNRDNADDCPDGPGGSCLIATCGDGFLHAQGTGAELCDDGNTNDHDDCPSTCSPAACGDGFVHDEGSGAETCDDGNGSLRDDCPDGPGGNCLVATCGDGFTHDQGTGDETDVDCGGSCLACPSGLLLSEVVVAPSTAEFIEVHNPTGASVNLSHVYLADTATYFGLTTNSNPPISSDFRLRFPSGAVLGAGEWATVALGSATDFAAEYGQLPDYDTDPQDPGAPAMTGQLGISAGLADANEMVVLFTWDGVGESVKDLDYLVYGNTTNGMDKTGRGSYQPETPLASQEPALVPSTGYSVGRCDDEWNEVATGGNGALGHDETSENLAATWALAANVTPGAENECLHCRVTVMDTACSSCAKTQCCAELALCNADFVCDCVFECVMGGGAALICGNVCGGIGNTQLNELFNCQTTAGCGCI
ncbi:MAG: hypothetical protein AUK47_06810 [Deltaproteobacteria bacterium CG2_30_63_29]|nr:MAG: hypothetical protein AUK47_06810 [Deltaproteobacteria bacterium CG2_30_63_29]PJB37681.1 MAG: hypothetical protein CO108_20570 [Deltaproteobacteria bacterium CG_4_9_14_3_um_filter_63_12]